MTAEKSTWLRLTDPERRALQQHDHVALFEMGAHPFLTLTLSETEDTGVTPRTPE